MACPDCGISIPALEPRSFSFNSVYGACPQCNGLGSKYDFDPARIIVDWSKPLLDGALGRPPAPPTFSACWPSSAKRTRSTFSTPFEKFSPKCRTCCSTGRVKKKRRVWAFAA